MKRKLFLISFLLLAFIFESSAQCAMCKAQLESNDGEVGNGINTGILFLMLVPYVLLSAILLVFFNGRLRSSLKRFINS